MIDTTSLIVGGVVTVLWTLFMWFTRPKPIKEPEDEVPKRELKTHNERQRFYNKAIDQVGYYTTCGRIVYGEDRVASRPTCAVCRIQLASGVTV